MVAYKPLQDSSAFRLWCKANDYNINDYDEIAKNIDNYVNDKKWKEIIEASKIFRGVIESISPSPCSFLLLDKPISKEVGLIKVGDITCCALDGYNCDVYKYLKDDFLTVTVYEIIDKVYKLINKPIDNISTLINNCDDKVWDIYEKGLTTTINQSDSDFAKQTLKRYKPKSLSEMSAWVAAIRPGFASLLDTFLDRKPYSTGVRELDDILKDSFHFLMYQESIMKYLVWLGIEERKTYDIIKKIAKKKFKEQELTELQSQLEKGWINNVGSSKGFDETWQVVQDAAHYSFNASHSLSVAIDSIYGAYLKSHYPLEYFSTVLTLYADDKIRTPNLVSELPYFGIELKPIKFGKSGSEYTMDKTNNSIYKGVSSIKYCNKTMADELLNLSKEKEYVSFIDLLDDIKNKTSVDNRQLRILIGLNYFSMFGKNKYLLDIVNIYDEQKENGKTIHPSFRSCSVISKNKIDNYSQYGITEYMIAKHSNEETKTQYKEIDNIGLLNEIISKFENASMIIPEYIKFEVEYLGYPTYVNPKIDESYYIVLEIKTYNDKSKPYFKLYQLSTGVEINTKISKSNVFNFNPFNSYSILKIDSFNERYKRKLIDNKWQITNEKEKVLENYSVIYKGKDKE